ncbi:unnamed protein product [Chondrus crispus]|uniref:Pyrroline-5-carboxylate reductase n=1 Tax=Chondrus crispus TaxID=2769 RepID=R7Q3T3_CHOCR|nr:unnamed protein product [Chondrus crispus]CDF32145.1 unnamed protein product [Chondrus crispus]|eukprot:XP_005711810.1 unnamed protein product [Chondrus crispus]
MFSRLTFPGFRSAERFADLSKFSTYCYIRDQKSVSFIRALPSALNRSISSRSIPLCPPEALSSFTVRKAGRAVFGNRPDLRTRSLVTTSKMNDVSVGFYGGGMMAEAILKGLLNRKTIAPQNMWVCELVQARREELAKLGVSVTADGEEMLSNSNTIFLAVKPNIVPIVLEDVTNFEKQNRRKQLLVVSICAGVDLGSLAAGNPRRKCIRVMPNQACLVGEAASSFTLNKKCTQEDREVVETLMGSCGLLSEVPEKSINAVTGLSGSGPAYVYMMMEAMSDAGVREGLPRAVARQLACQTVLGAAKMALEQPDVHLGELRNRVESPGGTTIAASAILENRGFRSAVIEAIREATNRAEEMSKKE